MRITPRRSAIVLAALACLAACGGAGDRDKASMQKAAQAMTQQRDSTINAMDSTRAGQQVDTSKLGAAKTESILTKVRKQP
jgi:ABC-type glycerol-3-phosphate transport system substrate-binding protein